MCVILLLIFVCTVHCQRVGPSFICFRLFFFSQDQKPTMVVVFFDRCCLSSPCLLLFPMPCPPPLDRDRGQCFQRCGSPTPPACMPHGHDTRGIFLSFTSHSPRNILDSHYVFPTTSPSSFLQLQIVELVSSHHQSLLLAWMHPFPPHLLPHHLHQHHLMSPALKDSSKEGSSPPLLLLDAATAALAPALLLVSGSSNLSLAIVPPANSFGSFLSIAHKPFSSSRRLTHGHSIHKVCILAVGFLPCQFLHLLTCL